MSLTRRQFSHYLFFFACLVCVTGLPLSKVLISNSLFLMAAAWLMQENLSERFRSFLNNRLAIILASFYILHVIGLLWTSDFKAAGNDLRVKLPILLFPLFFASGPTLTRKQIYTIIEVFAGAVTLSVLCSFAVYTGIYKKEIHDIREISLFVSHIRLSLMICISLVIHFILFRESRFWIKLYRVASGSACLGFLALTGSMTGFVILGILILIMGIRKIMQLSLIPKIASLFSLGSIAAVILIILGSEFNKFLNHEEEVVNELESHTLQGNPYTHYLDNDDREEGRRVYIYISWEELQSGWINRSSFDFEGKDKKGQELKYTLVRYMTALGLRKDAEGFDKLSDEDIHNIEDGITNPIYKNYGLQARIHQVAWELDHYIRGNDPSGHSVSMRFEFWKNGFATFREAPLFGVGTGDVKTELNKMYDARHSSLQEKWRLKPHNQYLSFAITFGIIGLGWFLIILLYPLTKNSSILYVSFSLIICISMLTEDTIETQQGVTLYAFLNSFLLFQYNSFERKELKE